MIRAANKERKQLDPVRTRQEILEAALAAFARKGYSGTSIGDIAGAAKVPKSLVQYHYGSKEELWQACLLHRAGPFIDVVDRVLSGDLSMSELFKARIALHQQHPDMSRLLAWVSLEPVPMPAFIVERRKALLELVKSTGRAGPNLDPHGFLLALATIDGWFLYRNLYGRLLGEGMTDSVTSDDLFEDVMRLLGTPTDPPTHRPTDPP